MDPIVQALIATLVISLISLVGVVFFFADWSPQRGMVFMSFAAGVLLATAFLEILPSALERHAGTQNLLAATLAAIGAFFVLERVLHGLHDHDTHESHAVPSGYLILVGDTLHNFVDGVVIAATFLADPALGVATTIAVAAHELPQEIADYGVLLSSNFTRTGALLWNFLSGLAAVLGALLCWGFQDWIEPHLAWVMASTAGMFIYVAAADLMPELHHARTRDAWRYTVPFFVGVLLIAVLGAIIPDAH
ncbi:MAG: ZIP family metal transporter [Deltaproteobacteria bacterium]|nr:ZIP family metal transporter [Deltaproteobacteria bacterium]